MGEETAHVGARIPPAQKERWKRHQKKSDYDTMTKWLKMIVESHIEGHSTAEDVASSEDVARVLDELDALRGDVSGLESSLDDVEQAEREATYDIDRVLLELLPQDEGITPEEMASRIGADFRLVESRLEELQDSTTGVLGTIDDSGAPLYKYAGDY